MGPNCLQNSHRKTTRPGEMRLSCLQNSHRKITQPRGVRPNRLRNSYRRTTRPLGNETELLCGIRIARQLGPRENELRLLAEFASQGKPVQESKKVAHRIRVVEKKSLTEFAS